MMDAATLDRATDFNDQLIALVELGLPIDLGFSPSTPLDLTLRRLNSDFGTQLRSGQPLSTVIDGDSLPSKYRAALQTWMRCDHPTVVFDAILQPDRDRRQIGSEFGQALIYPIIVGVIAYAGFIFFCVYLFPKIDDLYSQIDQPTSSAMVWIQWIRATMLIWVPLVPVLFVLGYVTWSRYSAACWRWLPGSDRYLDLGSGARHADQVAELIDQGASRAEASDMLQPLADQRLLQSTIPQSTIPQSTAQQSTVQHALVQRPLLDWALTGEIAEPSQSAALRFTASFYRRMAIRRSVMWRVVLPSVIGVLLAAVLVLGYGLSLFVPITDLLNDIAAVKVDSGMPMTRATTRPAP